MIKIIFNKDQNIILLDKKANPIIIIFPRNQLFRMVQVNFKQPVCTVSKKKEKDIKIEFGIC